VALDPPPLENPSSRRKTNLLSAAASFSLAKIKSMLPAGMVQQIQAPRSFFNASCTK
jgi:hypothetical protein